MKSRVWIEKQADGYLRIPYAAACTSLFPLRPVSAFAPLFWMHQFAAELVAENLGVLLICEHEDLIVLVCQTTEWPWRDIESWRSSENFRSV